MTKPAIYPRHHSDFVTVLSAHKDDRQILFIVTERAQDYQVIWHDNRPLIDRSKRRSNSINILVNHFIAPLAR